MIPKQRRELKEKANYHNIAQIAIANEILLYNLQRIKSYMKREMPNEQTYFRKGRGPKIRPIM